MASTRLRRIAAACVAVRRAGARAGRVRGRGPGRRGARPRGSRDRHRRHQLQRLHHPPAQPRDPAGQGLLRGPAGEAGQRALRRLPAGLQHQRGRGPHHHRRLRGGGQPGQRVRADRAARGQRVRLPQRHAPGRGVHPRGGQRGPARPDRGLDAPVRLPAGEHREPPARARGDEPATRRSASSWTSSPAAPPPAPSSPPGPPPRRPRRCARTARRRRSSACPPARTR